MDLYEYQARDIFEAYGVPVLRGVTATTPAGGEERPQPNSAPRWLWSRRRSRRAAAARRAGSRSPRHPDEAAARAEEILGLDIKGHVVKTVMIAEGADIAEEYYFSLLLDRANRRYLAMCSREGGMDIETLAVERPEALAQGPGRPERRHRPGQGGRDRRPPPASTDDDAAEIARRAAAARARCTTEEDATLVEVNPLVKTARRHRSIALDGKVSLDENADFRHPEHDALADKSAEDPLEAAAKAKDLNYVKLDGSRRASSATAPAW